MYCQSPLTVITPVASDAPSTCPVQTNTALRRAPLVDRRWSFRLKAASLSLPLGEKVKNCQQQWTTGLRSPRGIAAVAYAKNMPPACFLNAAGWRAAPDEGKGIGICRTSSEANPFPDKSLFPPNWLLPGWWRSPHPPQCAHWGTFPRGEGFSMV